MWLSRRRPEGERGTRHRVPLGPLTATMAAPPEVVFDVVAGPYVGRTPRALADKLAVVERSERLVVADHFTSVLGGRFTATTRETVAFDRPHRVTFRLLSGPVAHVHEEYRLTAAPGGTEFVYEGELGTDLPVLGRWWARTNARAWVAVVRRSMREIQREAERRAG